QHPSRGSLDTVPGVEFARFRAPQQSIIGHRIPEEVGELRCHRICPQFWIRRILHPEKETRRLEHRFDNRLRAANPAVLTAEQLLVARDFVRIQWAAEGPAAELVDELLTARGIVRTLRLAGDQAARISPAERIPGKPLRRAAVGL